MSIMSILVASGAKGRVSLSYTFSASTANASLNVTSLSGYSAGKSDITVTVNSGVYLWATAITAPGLSLTGGTTGDTITLVNNGFIMGKGGNGLIDVTSTTFIAAQSGGAAISISLPITINNTSGYIGGGGGGGGGTRGTSGTTFISGGAGGAGGGNGGGYRQSDGAGTAPGTVGGAIGQSGASGTVGASGSGGGGRVLPGIATTSSGTSTSDLLGSVNALGGTAGGTGSGIVGKGGYTLVSTGGGPNQAGSHTYNGTQAEGTNIYSAAGGGWGASGDVATEYISPATPGVIFTTPGAGGKAVELNGNTITWTGGSASSSRAYGAVS